MKNASTSKRGTKRLQTRSPERRRFSNKARNSYENNLNRRTITLTDKLRSFLSSASPTSSKRLIDAIAIDLGDLWAAGREHGSFLDGILRMNPVRNRERIASCLISGTTAITSEMDWHLRSLKRCVPKLLNDLDSGSRRRVRPGSRPR